MARQHETDFNDPKQRFVWAFEGIPLNGIPTILPTPTKEEWSERLSKAGFIHVSQLGDLADQVPFKQEIHYQPPVRGLDHAMNTSGKWVPVTQEIKAPVVPTASLMTAAEKAKMINEFREEGLLD